MAEAYIYDHVRTPRGKGRSNGGLHAVRPVELAAQVLRALRDRNQLDTALVDDVVLGVVTPVGEQGADIARPAALVAGYDQGVPGLQLDRFCSSGLEAVNNAAAQIMSGQSSLVIGGGVESMSRVPMGSAGGCWARDPQVSYETYFAPQGIGADLIATRSGFSRRDVDAYAVASQQRAVRAWSEGRFARSVIPVVDALGLPLLIQDEHIRADTTLETLAKLDPAFAQMGELGGYDSIAIQRYPEVDSIMHVHTAGNSSGIVDGAAGVLVGNREIGERLGIKPRARIRSFASVGSEPTIMLTGPAPASLKALRNAGMQASDIDLFELNEAFASVVLEYMRVLDVPHERINVNGGAIAMGHPLGATGAMLLGTVLDELERTGKSTALVTLCVGIGMGTATIIERL
ncbi:MULTISPECIES: acetyl-CoA C-acetyltransferase [Pseudomonas]|uniref:acetyl-CoA C-acetyltransferase n=1 Tax=Pseudomonas nitroreducens TaxID=46680 RepID=UPI001E5D6AE0|nr:MULTISPECIES: acetyl-CoA C-acetyltransferase [Pseudomonas]MCE4071463.1 acetyl-CoA C-acetyltransferase [Pseudomonas nitritireducens]MCE4081239.1 acetyl-CoA C-acetyltransferase [Pseudomonas nitroreducens]